MTGVGRWRAVWILLIACSGLYFFADNEADNDLWIHVRVGLDVLAGGVPRVDPYSYTAAGGPWIDHEWLLHALFGAVYQAWGSPALLLLKLAAGLTTLGILARSVARRTASVHLRGALLVLAAAVLARGFAIRPQVVTYVGVAALWAFLDDAPRRDSGWRWWLMPVFLLWANLHGGVLLGLGMTGVCAAWICFSRPREGFKLGLALGLGVAAALGLNPYGLAYGAYVWRELGAPHPITEWQAVSFEPAQASFFALAAVFLLALPFLSRWRARGWEAALAAALLVAALLQQRHTPAFALCAVPVAADGLDRLLTLVGRARPWRLSRGAQTALAAGMVLMALIQLGIVTQRLERDRLQIVFAPEDYPVAAVRQLAAAGVGGNLAVPLEWGGYVLWHLGPRIKVSLDGRFATVYPHEIVEENFAFFSGREEWRRLIEQHATDAVLAPSHALPPVQAMAGWHKVYADDVATLIARDGSALAGLSPSAPVVETSPVFP